MSNEQLKEEIMQEILDGLNINIDIICPHYTEELRVQLDYNGKVISSETIPNHWLGKGE